MMGRLVSLGAWFVWLGVSDTYYSFTKVHLNLKFVTQI